MPRSYVKEARRHVGPRRGRIRPIIERLNRDIVGVLTGGDVPKILMSRGYDPAPMTPETFAKYLQSEVARWSKAVKQYGIKSIE